MVKKKHKGKRNKMKKNVDERFWSKKDNWLLGKCGSHLVLLGIQDLFFQEKGL